MYSLIRPLALNDVTYIVGFTYTTCIISFVLTQYNVLFIKCSTRTLDILIKQ
jgi:hypothetical protein